VAFRFLIANNKPSIVNDDLTTFQIAPGSTIWSQRNNTSYEGEYKQQLITQVQKGQLAGPPLTIKLPEEKGYAAITEAGLTDFAGMSLNADENHVFKASLSGLTKKTSKIETPWRVILMGENLNQLVNSAVIKNISPGPDKKLFPQGAKTSWIKPSKSVWSWLAQNGG